jgi:hypothetical protein
MGEKTDEIERHIREQRRELGQNISELQQKVKDTVNWRLQFEHHPVAMLGIALGGGLLLSGIVGSRHRNHPASQDPERPKWDSKPRVPSASSAAGPAINEKTSESWQQIRAALIAVGAMKLGKLIDSIFPGFSDEYSKARGGNGSYSANRP